jgi:hypothetical protein
MNLATSDLAAGFAAHAAGWAGNRGAPADSIEALKIAAACVGDATAQGSVCIPLSALIPHIGDKPVADLRTTLLASRIVGTPDSTEVLPAGARFGESPVPAPILRLRAATRGESPAARGDPGPGAGAAAAR